MSKILFPIDGSEHAERALVQWLRDHPQPEGVELHLINVQLPVDGNVRSFVSLENLQDYYRAEALAALAGARQRLDEAGIPYRYHILVGHPADVICRFAEANGIDEIVMGTHGRTGLLELVMGSVASEVREKAKAQVTLVR